MAPSAVSAYLVPGLSTRTTWLGASAATMQLRIILHDLECESASWELIKPLAEMAESSWRTSCFMSLMPLKARPSDSQNFFFCPPPAPIASHCRYALANIARSELPTLLNSSARASTTFLSLYSSMDSSTSSSSFFLLNLNVSILRKGLRPTDIPAAIAKAALRHPIRHPMTSIFPTLGGAGIPARCIPRGVKVSDLSESPLTVETAPKLKRLKMAASMLFWLGGSRSLLRKLPDPRSTPRKSNDSKV
mmetsp:Transcript_13853/g.29613  ORF Transcript_13853/g.29613 Transcript_13853/m.29613 type:complete len:248 (+) Transcript_13853:2216-2959(+)